MSELYKKIESLCKFNGVTVTTMCKESGASRGSLSDLKTGRKQDLSRKTLSKIAYYFNVPVDYFSEAKPAKEKDPVQHHEVSDEDIKFALFGGGPVTDAQYAEVKQFVNFIKERDAHGSIG